MDRSSIASCSVVICTRDRPEKLDRCLKALREQDYAPFETVVVDNAPINERGREVAQAWGARYIVEPLPGLSRARNRGLAECRSEIVAYIDDDAVAEPGWLSALAAEFADPAVMAAAGRIAPERREPVARTETNADRISLSRRVFDRSTPGWFETSNFGGIGIGANMAVRRKVLGRWGGFDERLGRGAVLYAGEENYAFFSLINLGYRVVYAPAAAVRHASPQDREQLLALLAAGFAYALFLCREHPSYRRDVIRFFLRPLIGVARPWRQPRSSGTGLFGHRWVKPEAAVRGIMLYARSRASQKAGLVPQA